MFPRRYCYIWRALVGTWKDLILLLGCKGGSCLCLERWILINILGNAIDERDGMGFCFNVNWQQYLPVLVFTEINDAYIESSTLHCRYCDILAL